MIPAGCAMRSLLALKLFGSVRHSNLSKLNRMGIDFITLRRRSQKLLDEVARTPASAWRLIELESTWKSVLGMEFSESYD